MPPSRLDFEIAHLALATRLIADGEQRVLRQQALVEDQRSRGVSTEDSENLLALFVVTMSGWKAHRCLIEDTIARLERSVD